MEIILTKGKLNRWWRVLLVSITISLLTSCAHVKNSDDPLEPFNRSMYKVNYALDKIIFHPFAVIYDTALPNFAKRGVNNFFYNFYEPTRIINFLLRAEFTHALEHTSRFVVNTTVGLGGFIDIGSTRMNLPRRRSDLGMTLAKWGYKNSTFIYVPIFGPTTIRDGLSYLVDIYAFSPWLYIQPPSMAWTMYGVDLLHNRAELLPTDKLIDEAVDPYVFVREAYLQKRRKDLGQVVDEFKETEDTFVEE